MVYLQIKNTYHLLYLFSEKYIAKIAFASSIIYLFSQISTLQYTFRTNDLKKLDFNVFFTGFLNQLMWLIYAIKVDDQTQILVSAISSVVNFVYMCFYFWFKPNKKQMVLGGGVTVMAVWILWQLRKDNVGQFCNFVYFLQ